MTLGYILSLRCLLTRTYLRKRLCLTIVMDRERQRPVHDLLSFSQKMKKVDQIFHCWKCFKALRDKETETMVSTKMWRQGTVKQTILFLPRRTSQERRYLFLVMFRISLLYRALKMNAKISLPGMVMKRRQNLQSQRWEQGCRFQTQHNLLFQVLEIIKVSFRWKTCNFQSLQMIMKAGRILKPQTVY